MKNEKKKSWKIFLENIFGRISNTTFLTETFVIAGQGQTQSQNQP